MAGAASEPRPVRSDAAGAAAAAAVWPERRSRDAAVWSRVRRAQIENRSSGPIDNARRTPLRARIFASPVRVRVVRRTRDRRLEPSA